MTNSEFQNPRFKPPTRDLSIVLGCYNGGQNLEANILTLLRFLNSLGRTHEVLVVEDGSRDASLSILRRLEAEWPDLTVLRNPKNMGKGFSIRNGILNCSGKYIIFTDSDMAYSIQNVLTVLEELEKGHPVVVGNRRLPNSVYTVNNALVKYIYRRHRIGVAFNALVRLLFGVTTRDTQSGLKGFRYDVAAQIFDRILTDGFLFDVELFICAKKLGIPIEEIPVHVTYTTDDSTVSQIRSFFSILPELIRIKLLEIRGGYDGTMPGAKGATGEKEREADLREETERARPGNDPGPANS